MIVALIPARGGSKRIERKNLLMIGGKTLVEWAILAAVYSKKIDRVYVSSEDEEILRVAGKHDVVPIKRDAGCSDDDSTDRDVITDFMCRVRHPAKAISQIVYIRPTTPLRQFHEIDRAINAMAHIDATGLRSVHEMSETAYKCFKMRPGQILEGVIHRPVDYCNMPAQLYPKTYHPNGVVDIVRPEVVLSGKYTTYGDSVYGLITSPVVEIDTLDDYRLVQAQVAFQQNAPADIWRNV